MTSSDPRWFGVQLWKRWLVDDELSGVEEAIVLIRAESADAARSQALAAAAATESEYTNVDSQKVTIRVGSVSAVWDTGVGRLRSGLEVFSQVYEVTSSGDIDDGHPRA
jgi:hypothetical protein